MTRKERRASNLELVGGRLCLDFANTVSTRVEGLGQEYLTTYNELVAWGRHAGVLSDEKAQALNHDASRRPDLAAAALERAVVLREAIHRIFSALADHREPQRADLAAMNSALREAFSRLEVLPSNGGFDWAWVVDEDNLEQILWSIVRSAAELLTSRELSRVRECAREGCDWLFVDTSKNHSRRWCSMTMCGSRVKMRRYYRRRKKGKGD